MCQFWLSEESYRPCEILWWRGEDSTSTTFVVPNGAALERGPKVFLDSIRLLKKCFFIRLLKNAQMQGSRNPEE